MTPCLRESHMKGLSFLTQYVMWKYLIHPPISLWQSHFWKGGTLILYLALTKPSLSKVILILLLFNQQIVLYITPSRLLKGPQAFLTRNIYCGAVTLV